MAANTLLTAYTRLRSAVDVPLEYYYDYLPTMPHGETPVKLTANGFPRVNDLLDGLLVAAMLTAARTVLTRYVFVPFGRMAMKHRYHGLQRIRQLDEALEVTNYYNGPELERIAETAQVDLSQAARYLRIARNSRREAKALTKFCEVAFKLVVHLSLNLWGIYSVLFKERWFWDPHSAWAEYPFFTISRAVYWYYMLEMGTYIHELLVHFVETRRSDFLAMLIHHVATLMLITGSYVCNFIPIGAVVLLVHGVADSFLTGAKLFKYMSKARPWAQSVAVGLFVAFAITFFLSRLVVFPFYVLRASLTVPQRYFDRYLGLDLLNGFLMLLVCLHLYWMAMIVRMAVRLKANGKDQRDDRSDVESELEESDKED